MKTAIILALCAALTLLFAGAVLAGPAAPSIELGKKLFNEVQPGITGKTCADCHPDGAGLERSGKGDDPSPMINKCTTNALHGSTLAPDSVEMQSLILYINSLKAKKKPAVGC